MMTWDVQTVELSNIHSRWRVNSEEKKCVWKYVCMRKEQKKNKKSDISLAQGRDDDVHTQ